MFGAILAGLFFGICIAILWAIVIHAYKCNAEDKELCYGIMIGGTIIMCTLIAIMGYVIHPKETPPTEPPTVEVQQDSSDIHIIIRGDVEVLEHTLQEILKTK